MKVLITGANGQVGWELARQGARYGLEIAALDRGTLDITDFAGIKKTFIRIAPALVVNAAAYTAVDRAESEPELAFAVNRDGPAYLAAACAGAGISLVHLSTDYVFDGSKTEPYRESDPISPLGVYGRSKAAGERKVREHVAKHIIIRTAWLYGVHGNNFVKTMLRLGQGKQVVKVVADQKGCPTYAADLAEAILTIASYLRASRRVAWGTYHYCGKGVTTWHGFAVEIFRLAKQHDSLVVEKAEPITTAEYPTPTKRPANSALDCSLLLENFGIQPKPWNESLDRMLKQYYRQRGMHLSTA